MLYDTSLTGYIILYSTFIVAVMNAYIVDGSEHRSISVLFVLAGAKLVDGIPKLRQILSRSPPYVPAECDHASCKRIEADFPSMAIVSENILNAPNGVWDNAKTDGNGSHYLTYCSEADIVYIVRRFLENIMLALNLRLEFNAEVMIKQVRPNICVLSLGMFIVGVVEVKKPGRNVLLQPTVLGELLDQMLLVEGFYRMGPVIGILTTAEEWIVSWFPVDTNDLKHFCTSSSDVSISTALQFSPMDCLAHTIEVAADDSPDGDDSDESLGQMERLLYTTAILNIHNDPFRVVQLLCSAFKRMANSRNTNHHRPNLSRCLLKFHQGQHAVTFHPYSASYAIDTHQIGKFPANSIKTLVALQDLGIGSTGRAWLCIPTLTRPCPALCVVKFDNTHANSNNLVREKEMWTLLYPEFSQMVRLERWSGADALLMPYFSTVPEEERVCYKVEVLKVLREKFVEKSKVHLDVYWRNIGKYITRENNIEIVIYDLHDVVDYDADAHNDWVENAMNSLYETV